MVFASQQGTINNCNFQELVSLKGTSTSSSKPISLDCFEFCWKMVGSRPMGFIFSSCRDE